MFGLGNFRWITFEGEVKEHKEKQAAQVKRNPSGGFKNFLAPRFSQWKMASLHWRIAPSNQNLKPLLSDIKKDHDKKTSGWCRWIFWVAKTKGIRGQTWRRRTKSNSRIGRIPFVWRKISAYVSDSETKIVLGLDSGRSSDLSIFINFKEIFYRKSLDRY